MGRQRRAGTSTTELPRDVADLDPRLADAKPRTPALLAAALLPSAPLLSLKSLTPEGPLALDGDDYPADPSTTGAVTLGGSVAGVFEINGDEDWFAITLTAGQSVELTGPAALTSILFYDTAGNPVAVDFFRVFNIAAGTQSAGFTATTAGTYYVGVSGTTGSYTIGAQVSAGNANDVDAFPNLPTGTVQGFPQATKWFRVELNADDTLHLGTYYSGTFAFYDVFGNRLQSEHTSGGFDSGAFTATQGGTYYVSVSNIPPNGSFTVTVYTDDHPDAYGIGDPGDLPLNGSATGTLEVTGDADWFEITLGAGQSIDVTGPWWLSTIAVYDVDGNPIEVDFFTFDETNKTIGFTTAVAGTYYVAVAGLGTGANYTLTTEERTTPHPNDVDTFIQVTASGLVQGVYGPSGGQWFRVDLLAGQTLSVDADVVIFDAYGNRLFAGQNTNLTQDRFTYYTTAQAGTFFFSTGGPAGSSYSFETLIYADDAPDNLPPFAHPSEPFPLLDASGDQVAGHIEIFDDEDFYAIDLVAGQTMRLRLEFTGLHGQSSELRVSVSNGVSWTTFVGQHESVEFSEIVFTAPSDGRYYVRIDGPLRYVGDYTLTLTPATPADAFDGEPSIMPSLPTQPTTQNVSSTIAYPGGHTVVAGTTLYAVNLPDGPPYGSPVINASNHPFGDPTLDNAGEIFNFSNEYRAFGVSGVTADRLINSGTIVAQSNTPYPSVLNSTSATGVYIVGYLPTGQENLQNSGEIFARAVGGSATGVITGDPSAILRNSGLIAAEAQWAGRDAAIAGGAAGVSFQNGGTLINEASGRIVAVGDGFAAAVAVHTWTLTVTNHGVIEAQALGAHALSHGISAWPSGSNSGLVGAVVHNYGTIRADQALYGEVSLTNYAGGVVEGDIVLFSFPNGLDHDDIQTITNHGTITGNVDMGDGADVFNNTGGLVNGVVDMAQGDDTYTGGDNADLVLGGHGDDSLTGAGGQDLLLASYGDDTIVGGAGNDGLYGEIGADHIVTAGGDVVSGGLGHDRIETGDYTFASIAGDAGFDTWVLPAGARTLDLSLVAASGRVSGFEALELVGNQLLVLRVADVAALSGASSLYISGAATDSVYLAGAWASGAQTVRNGVTFASFVAGGVTVFVEIGLTVTVGETPPVGTGLEAVAGGAAAPSPGSIPGADLSPAIITEGLRIIGALVIGEDEIWESQYGQTVFYAADLTGQSFVNYGSIFSTGSTHPLVSSPWGLGALGAATALTFIHIDSFENHGSVVAAAILDGLATAFVGTSFDGVVNAPTGLIHAYADNGLAIAFDGFGVGSGWGDWSLHNQGDIYAFSNTGFAIAVSESNGVYILNDGVIEADGGDGAIAVDLSNAGEGVWNRGEIIAFAPPTSTFFSFGIRSDGHTVIVNDGLIAAEIAIDIYDRNTEPVQITNNGTIIGAIIRTHNASWGGGRVDLTNTGSITGPILFTTGTNINNIVNSGIIDGDIILSVGADVYDGRTGQLVGEVHTAAGDDWLRGGAGVDRFYGEAGADTLEGNNGADVLTGGLGADIIQGGAGNDTINYALGDGVDTTDGGADTDTLVVTDGAAAATLNVVYNGVALTTIAGNTFTNIEVVHANLGGGSNSLVYASSVSLTVNLNTSTASGFASVAGIANVTGGSGADTITGDAGVNVISGLVGADTLSGLAGDDTLNGGDGVDTLIGGTGFDTINGGAGNDVISWAWGDGNGVIDGGADSDAFNILGNSAANILKVNWNGSVLTSAAGNALANVETVTADLGGGSDLLEYNAGSAAVSVNLSTGVASGFASIANILHVTGAGGNDVITGDNAINKLNGGDGGDTLSGGAGNDQLNGGNGVDTFYAGLGNDNVNGDAGNDLVFWVWGDGGDTVNGGADFDTVTFTGTGDSNLFKIVFNGTKITSLNGNPLSNVEAVIANTGGGADWLIYKSATVAITVNLSTGIASGLASFTGVSHVQGGTGNDVFTGDDLFNKFEGGDGNDTISAGGDNDVLNGGNGNDTLTGGTGADAINAGDGDDTIVWAWNDGGDGVDGGAGNDTISFIGDGAVNLIKATWNGSVLTNVMSCALTGIEAVHASGGGGLDWLVYNGSVGATANLTTLTASGFASIAGFANLQGGNGDDSLTGDANANKFIGGDGADTIAGLGGNDTITGGLGADTFVYAAGAGTDSIADFDADAVGGQDLLDITGFGITASDFGARVTIFDAGANTVVTIDGSVVITLTGVNGVGDNLITMDDFLVGGP